MCNCVVSPQATPQAPPYKVEGPGAHWLHMCKIIAPPCFWDSFLFRFRISCFCVWVSNIHDSRTRGSRFYESIEILKSCDDYISVYINFLMDTQNIDAYAVTTIYMKAHNTRCTMIIILLYAATNGWPGDGQVSREPGRLDASWLHLGILK